MPDSQFPMITHEGVWSARGWADTSWDTFGMWVAFSLYEPSFTDQLTLGEEKGSDIGNAGISLLTISDN